jgi:hypothetical protein
MLRYFDFTRYSGSPLGSRDPFGHDLGFFNLNEGRGQFIYNSLNIIQSIKQASA